MQTRIFALIAFVVIALVGVSVVAQATAPTQDIPPTVTPTPTLSPYDDVPPGTRVTSLVMPIPAQAVQAVPFPERTPFACEITGDDIGFEFICSIILPTPTPTVTPIPTPTEVPSFYYVWCPNGDADCTTISPPIWRKLDHSQLACTLVWGDKVTVRAVTVPGERAQYYLDTQGDEGGGNQCSGWIWADWVRKSN